MVVRSWDNYHIYNLVEVKLDQLVHGIIATWHIRLRGRSMGCSYTLRAWPYCAEDAISLRNGIVTPHVQGLLNDQLEYLQVQKCLQHPIESLSWCQGDM